MDFESILPSFYRLRFREYLERIEARRDARRTRDSTPLIFADLLVTRDDPHEVQAPPAPQGLGEMKHGAVDDPTVEFPLEPGDIVPEAQPRGADWEAVSAYKMAIGPGAGPDASRRSQIEEQVRRIKALGQVCPYRTDTGVCAVPYVRCGERHQFAVRESVRQHSMPHPCRYIPGHEGEYVLVADNDERLREFVKSSLTLFLNVDEGRILTADSAQKAIDIMNRFKTQDRVVGLLIVDENMPGMSGSAGDRFIAARKRVVHRTLIKPIHSDTLTEATQEVYRPVG